MNKFLEILMGGFDEESDSEMIAKIQSIEDYEESIEMVNILVALGRSIRKLSRRYGINLTG